MIKTIRIKTTSSNYPVKIGYGAFKKILNDYRSGAIPKSRDSKCRDIGHATLFHYFSNIKPPNILPS